MLEMCCFTGQRLLIQQASFPVSAWVGVHSYLKIPQKSPQVLCDTPVRGLRYPALSASFDAPCFEGARLQVVQRPGIWMADNHDAEPWVL